MNKDELARAHLSTVLRMAVRLGRLSVPDHAMDAELRDLAQLYLDATGNPMAWDAIKLVLGAAGVPMETPAEQETYTADRIEGLCGFELPTIKHDGDYAGGLPVGHVHRCDKAQGHDDGPGGSDHQCESCGCLYDADGGTASPLGMAGLPLGGNGPVEEQGEIEL